MAFKPNNSATDNAFRVMLRTYGVLSRVMQPYFARFGISGAQWGVLRSLHRAENEGHPSLRLTDLSERLIIRPPSVTAMVMRLERMGLASRNASNTDRRVKHARLTNAGRRLVKTVLKHHDKQIATILDGLSAAEQTRLRDLLQKWMCHLESIVDRPVNLPARPSQPTEMRGES